MVRTNVAGLNRVPGIQLGELLFITSEQHDDGALKISRRKNPIAKPREARVPTDVYENRTLNETDLPSATSLQSHISVCI